MEAWLQPLSDSLLLLAGDQELVSLLDLALEVGVVCQQRLEVHRVLVKEHTCDSRSTLLTVRLLNEPVDGVSHESALVSSGETVQLRNVNLGQFDLRDLLLSLRSGGLLVGSGRRLLLSLVSWLLLIRLVLVVASSATTLTAPAASLIVLLTASRSVVEFVSPVLTHVVRHLVHLRI